MPSIIPVANQTLPFQPTHCCEPQRHTLISGRQLQGSCLCLNCVASLCNSGNEFTLSVASIMFTQFWEQPAGRGAWQHSLMLVNAPAPLHLSLTFITPATQKSTPLPLGAGNVWMYSNLRCVNPNSLFKRAGFLGGSPLSSPEAKELMPVFQ